MDFHACYRQYKDSVYRYLLAARLDRDLARELTIETFGEFYDALEHRERRIENPEAFVFAIARNLLRASIRRPRVEIVGLEQAQAPASVRDPHTLLEASEELTLAIGVLQELPPVARQVCLLRFVDDKQISEIAALLEIPENTIKSHIHRARQVLLAHRERDWKGVRDARVE